MASEKPQNIQSHVTPVVAIPGYKIIDVLGRGGMAIVYKAIQESVGRTVAIKVLAPNHTDDTFTDRFLREAQIISNLTHPNIITVFDAGVHKSHHYMSMEYISGKTLRDARDDLSRKQKIAILKQIAMALDYAGKKGYVHRDIKPENIMIHEDGRAVLMDFGIARGDDTARGLTLTGKAIGTPYYMSPEQTKGIKVDFRSDIYSLGVVLYQALTGNVPYDGNSFVDVGMKHITEPIPTLPRGLESFQPIINKAMSKDPEHRYQSASELLAALNSISMAELDYVDSKSAVISNKAIDYDAATLVGSDIAPPLKNKSKLKSNIKPGLQIRGKTEYQRKSVAEKMDITTTNEYKKTKWRNRILFLLLISSITFAVYINQKTIEPYWQHYALPLLHKYLPSEIKLKIGLNETAVSAAKKEKITTLQIKKVIITQFPESLFKFSNFFKTETDLLASNITEAEQVTLQANLDQKPGNANDLIGYYKKILSSDKNNVKARKGVVYLRQWFRRKLNASFKNEDIVQARLLLNILKIHFPHVVNDGRYQKMENVVLQQESIKTHLRLAKAFINKKQYITPVSENALEELLVVLSIEPKNIRAKSLQSEMLDIFVEQVKSQQAIKNYESAILSAESGLKISKNDAFLKSSYGNLKKLLKAQQQVDNLLVLANTQMTKGNFVTPANNNAFKIYHSILTLEMNNKIAIGALTDIELKLVEQATQAIKSNNISNAKLILQLLEQYYPNSEHIKKTQTKLAEAIDSKNPAVTKIVFSDVLMSSMVKMADIRIQSGKTIYIGISFKHFSKTATYLLVRLLDNTAVNKLIQKTVKINGTAGEQIFSIDIPEDGLSPGNYYVELKLGKRSLIKKSFQIFKP